ncbi:MAG: efflux RND transporter periplasmic adaptor subunit [Planctomycetota bacterium]|nr:efflux RND transporter periplasmic adaptor subunit [Planctomycetota bacterium]
MRHVAKPQTQKTRAAWPVAAVLPIVLLSVSRIQAELPSGIEGFTAPYRVLQIGAPEAGIVEKVLVKEGDPVGKGDVLAKLDCDVHMALLAIARKSMELEGRLKSAEAELELRTRRLELIKRLHSGGHARPEELQRAVADHDIAAGNALSAQEQLVVKQLEYDKIMAQIERRSIRAPIDGVVTTLVKQEGEFAAPNDPQLLVLVQLDPLLGEFAVPWSDASKLTIGESVSVVFEESDHKVSGSVEFISPLTDAESGTVPVKVRLDNPDGALRSGDRCRLQLNK